MNDLGYLLQGAEEPEVLFILIAERQDQQKRLAPTNFRCNQT